MNDRVTGIEPSKLMASVDPARYRDEVVEIVEKLNEMGEEFIGGGQANFVGSRWYLAIQWGDILLWDSEGLHRDDRDFPDDYGHEPSVELCLEVLRQEAECMLRFVEQGMRMRRTKR